MAVAQIVTYHRVNTVVDGVFNPVHPDVFYMQIKHLSKYYRLLTSGELGQGLNAGKLPYLAANITFDDGYRDNYDYAFPALKRLGARATIFLSTGPLETGIPLWHDSMFTAFAWTNKEEWSFRGITYSLREQSDRAKAAGAFANWVKTIDEDDRESAVKTLCGNLAISPQVASQRTPMLTWDQVIEMAEWGIEIGAHTVTHPILSRLPRKRQEEEIVGSIETIERRIGIRPTVFAYPNGRLEDFNEDTINILKKLRIQAAFTTVFGANRLSEDRFFLRRGAAWSGNPLKFALQMIWYRWFS